VTAVVVGVVLACVAFAAAAHGLRCLMLRGLAGPGARDAAPNAALDEERELDEWVRGVMDAAASRAARAAKADPAPTGDRVVGCLYLPARQLAALRCATAAGFTWVAEFDARVRMERHRGGHVADWPHHGPAAVALVGAEGAANADTAAILRDAGFVRAEVGEGTTGERWTWRETARPALRVVDGAGGGGDQTNDGGGDDVG
jgi:hypothetical protein